MLDCRQPLFMPAKNAKRCLLRYFEQDLVARKHPSLRQSWNVYQTSESSASAGERWPGVSWSPYTQCFCIVAE